MENPESDLGNILFAFAIFGMLLLWMGLSVFGLEAKAVGTARVLLPSWFFVANLFFAPLMLILAGGPVAGRLPRMVRLGLFCAMFCSCSLFVVTPQHQAVGLLMLGFIYLEAFWIIPHWNRWSERRRAVRGEAVSGRVAKPLRRF
jgi:hypothetical protein